MKYHNDNSIFFFIDDPTTLLFLELPYPVLDIKMTIFQFCQRKNTFDDYRMQHFFFVWCGNPLYSLSKSSQGNKMISSRKSALFVDVASFSLLLDILSSPRYILLAEAIVSHLRRICSCTSSTFRQNLHLQSCSMPSVVKCFWGSSGHIIYLLVY